MSVPTSASTLSPRIEIGISDDLIQNPNVKIKIGPKIQIRKIDQAVPKIQESKNCSRNGFEDQKWFMLMILEQNRTQTTNQNQQNLSKNQPNEENRPKPNFRTKKPLYRIKPLNEIQNRIAREIKHRKTTTKPLLIAEIHNQTRKIPILDSRMKKMKKTKMGETSICRAETKEGSGGRRRRGGGVKEGDFEGVNGMEDKLHLQRCDLNEKDL